MINILFADNQITLHHTFIKTLECTIPNAVIEYERNEADGFEKGKNNTYDLIIINFTLAGLRTEKLITEILLYKPKARLLILAMQHDKEQARKFLSLGIMGYINLSSPEAEIRRAIEIILENKRYINATVLESLAMSVMENRKSHPFR